MFVGIDWASRAHELCVVDEEGAVVTRFGFAHSERGISETLGRLAKLGRPGELPVAIERPDGLLVGRLLEAGHPVVPIHPNAFHAARPRWEGAGSKSDPGDAYRLADLLRTDLHRLRPLRPLGCGGTGRFPHSIEEGSTWGKHGFPHGSEPKARDAHL